MSTSRGVAVASGEDIEAHCIYESNHPPRGYNPGRKCFVTVGSTTTFLPLVQEVLTERFLAFMLARGYDEVTIQCGDDVDWARQELARLPDQKGINIVLFKTTDDIRSYMVATRPEVMRRLSGCVISHAGSGSILDAKRFGAPLVVVANPALLNNHQEELANEVERKKWAIKGELGNLTDAVARVLDLTIQGGREDLPPYEEPAFPTPEPERCTLFDWMALTCYPEMRGGHERLRELRRPPTGVGATEGDRLRLD